MMMILLILDYIMSDYLSVVNFVLIITSTVPVWNGPIAWPVVLLHVELLKTKLYPKMTYRTTPN